MSITYKRTHIGKIGRLDSDTRHVLSVRLENGEPHKSLVAWLNSLPEVQEKLKFWFEGRPITEQNLSEWKQHGHQEWLRLQETRQLARQLTEDAETLEVDTDGDLLSDKLAVMVTAELGRLMATLLEDEKLDVETKWKRLKEIHRELSQLRRDDHRAAKVKLARKQREAEEVAAMETETKRLQEERKSKLIHGLFAPLENKTMGRTLDQMGMGGMGEQIAELAYRNRNDLPYKEQMDELIKQNEREAGPRPGNHKGKTSKTSKANN